MAVQNPFFGKREPESFQPRSSTTSGSVLGSNAVNNSAASAQPVPPAAAPKPSSASDSSGSKLTVGPNIKLKGVEITDCDTLVVEGSVEATMDSRVIEISERGAFKGSAEIDIAEIRGLFDGNLTVREKLTIFSTGQVTGRIRYGKVVIEEGGRLSGEIDFGTAPAAAHAETPQGRRTAA